MSKKSKEELFRAERASELEYIAHILEQRRLCIDVSPLRRAASLCQARCDKLWSYNVTSLLLHVGDSVSCIPTHLTKFDCRLDVLVQGVCFPLASGGDPLERHKIDIVLKAPNSNPAKPSYLQSWHIDRHHGSLTAAPPTHPRYHLSFGGREMNAHLRLCNKPHFDGVLLLDSPRIPHPPMDAVLAIDFVLSHFAGPAWRILRNDHAYNRILASAQELLWLPYVRALASRWPNDAITPIWGVDEVWPNL